jgi:hypothetical protein
VERTNGRYRPQSEREFVDLVGVLQRGVAELETAEAEKAVAMTGEEADAALKGQAGVRLG